MYWGTSQGRSLGVYRCSALARQRPSVLMLKDPGDERWPRCRGNDTPALAGTGMREWRPFDKLWVGGRRLNKIAAHKFALLVGGCNSCRALPPLAGAISVLRQTEYSVSSNFAVEPPSEKEQTMFEVEQLIDDCKHALNEDGGTKAVREIAAQAVSKPAELIDALGEPQQAKVGKLYHSQELTILNLVWAPYMTLQPHNHNMWAVIGIYTGAEDNIFWRRTPQGIEAAGARALRAGDATPLGRDIIHSVTNPTPRFTDALHIYGGDFFNEARSEWDPDTLSEQPYDAEKTLRRFSEANARYLAGQQQLAD